MDVLNSLKKYHGDKMGWFTLDAQRSGQTYFVTADGKKYPSGQVTEVTGKALDKDNVWVGLSAKDIDSLPDGVNVEPSDSSSRLPSSFNTELEFVDQGAYPLCVPVTLMRLAELAYYKETGERKKFSAMQFYIEAGGQGGGLDAQKAAKMLNTIGLVEQSEHPYPELRYMDENWLQHGRDRADAVNKRHPKRYRFSGDNLFGAFRGSEEPRKAFKRRLMEYGALAVAVDPSNGYFDGVEFTEDSIELGHEITITGWNSNDEWHIAGTYANQKTGVLHKDYPFSYGIGVKML